MEYILGTAMGFSALHYWLQLQLTQQQTKELQAQSTGDGTLLDLSQGQPAYFSPDTALKDIKRHGILLGDREYMTATPDIERTHSSFFPASWYNYFKQPIRATPRWYGTR